MDERPELALYAVGELELLWEAGDLTLDKLNPRRIDPGLLRKGPVDLGRWSIYPTEDGQRHYVVVCPFDFDALRSAAAERSCPENSDRPTVLEPSHRPTVERHKEESKRSLISYAREEQSLQRNSSSSSSPPTVGRQTPTMIRYDRHVLERDTECDRCHSGLTAGRIVRVRSAESERGARLLCVACHRRNGNRHGDAEARISAFIVANPMSSMSEIRRATSIPRSTVGYHLGRLVKGQRIYPVGRNSKTRYVARGGGDEDAEDKE
jgi:hypothetical protein